MGPSKPDSMRASENAPEIAVRLQPNSRSKEGKKELKPKYAKPVLVAWVTQPRTTSHHFRSTESVLPEVDRRRTAHHASKCQHFNSNAAGKKAMRLARSLSSAPELMIFSQSALLRKNFPATL